MSVYTYICISCPRMNATKRTGNIIVRSQLFSDLDWVYGISAGRDRARRASALGNFSIYAFMSLYIYILNDMWSVCVWVCILFWVTCPLYYCIRGKYVVAGLRHRIYILCKTHTYTERAPITPTGCCTVLEETSKKRYVELMRLS